MNRFSDRNGKMWTIDLAFGQVLRIKKEYGIDLLNPSDGEPSVVEKVMFDYEFLYECIWACVEPQAAAEHITAAQFGEAIAADCLVAAKQVFLAEWRDFFQSLQRQDLVQALDKLLEIRGKAVQMVQAKLNPETLARLDQKIDRAMSEALNKHFGPLLES